MSEEEVKTHYPDPDEDVGETEKHYPDPDDIDDIDEDDKKPETEESKKKKEEEDKTYGNKFHKHRVTADTVDHYEVLGLAHLRWEATDAQIRSAYRKMSLQYHPDKLAAETEPGKPVDDTIFKRISKAYEILSDPQKRKEYDSQDENFDEKIPSEKDVTKDNFYDVLGPVFDRNSRWSVVRPVPRLGDENTPYDEVKRFYAFWKSFRTWRELPLDDQYDPNEATSREEKRWILRQNEKQRQKKRNEEKARIQRLVNLAERLDPCVLAKKEQEREEREARAKEKAEAEERRRKQAEAEAEEKRKAAEAAEAEKKRKEEERKKQIVAAKNALLKFMKNPKSEWPRDPQTSYEIVLSSLRNEEDAVVEYVKALPRDSIEKTREALLKTIAEVEADRAERAKRNEEEARKKREAEAAEREAKKNRKPWSEDEVAQLARAVRKYPPGVRDRWTKIAQLMCTTRTEEEIIDKTQEMKAADAHSVSHLNAYVRLKSQTENTDIEAPPEIAWDRINSQSTASTKVVKVEVPLAPDDPRTWTPEEQKLLENGLRTFKGKERWEKIAETIPGRTKEMCRARFNYVKEMLTKQQQQKQ